MKELLSAKELGCPTGLTDDNQGWNSIHKVFNDFIDLAKPQVIVEVGSWKGCSAINMAKLAPAAKVYCVDTWLGGIDHLVYESEDPYAKIQTLFGYPQVYFQFLHNVTAAGVANRVYPIAQTSTNGAKTIKMSGVVPDLIYIDASHELRQVYDDVSDYWTLLRPGGVMFGDDWGMYGVQLSVARFCAEQNLHMDIEADNYWSVQKL